MRSLDWLNPEGQKGQGWSPGVGAGSGTGNACFMGSGLRPGGRRSAGGGRVVLALTTYNVNALNAAELAGQSG